MNTRARKKALRHVFREQRRSLDVATRTRAGQQCAILLDQTPEWRESQHIGAYLAADGEIPTEAIFDLAAAAGKHLYLPAIIGDRIEFRPWRPAAALIPNRYGIGEPGSAAVDPDILDMLLMPLVAWGDNGSRLGMGGGYYDRFLAVQEERTRRIGLGYELQRSPELAMLKEPWDRALNGVITEAGIYRFDDGSRSGSR